MFFARRNPKYQINLDIHDLFLTKPLLLNTFWGHYIELVWPCPLHTDWLLLEFPFDRFVEREKRKRRASESRLRYLYEKMMPFLCYLTSNPSWLFIVVGLLYYQENWVGMSKGSIKKSHLTLTMYKCSLSVKNIYDFTFVLI